MDQAADDLQFLTTRGAVVFLDVQGFRTFNHRFIVKEICLSDYDDDEIFHAIIKSPYSFNKLNGYYQRQAEWTTRFCHGLTFDSGDMSIIELLEKVYPRIKDKQVIVKGAEKLRWLRYIFRKCGEIHGSNVDDVAEISKECDEKMYDICDYHNEVFGWEPCRCALSTVLKLKEYKFMYC